MNTNDLSFLDGSNTAFMEAIEAQYRRDPASVEPTWREFFARIDAEPEPKKINGHANGHAASTVLARPATAPATGEVPEATRDSIRALMLVRAYRVRGHLIASLDPLQLEGEKHHPELDPASYGFTESDYDRPIYFDGVLGLNWATLREALSILKQTYCARIGVEFMHIQSPEEKAWIQNHIEGSRNRTALSPAEKRTILADLGEAEGFETFLDIKYRGAKRFSLEGCEPVIPGLEAIILRAADLGVEEIVFGMSHRGRLNVLTSVIGKSYAAVFSEFQGEAANPDDVQGSGDVKYHLGASADRDLPNGKRMHLSLTPNPSHLEAVNPVVLGRVRAKQNLKRDTERKRVMSLLLHGDAAFAGQGLVGETLELSELKGYRVGGTIHIIVNNQIGFTTNPTAARSSPYSSDIAKVVQAPIFHVNGDDPEAVVHICRLATEFRQTFGSDVVLDIIGYRRHGHNEGDEPAFTQPIMYRAIRSRPTPRQVYTEQLVADGTITVQDADKMAADFRARLDKELEASRSYKPNKADWLEGEWRGFEPGNGEYRAGETAVELATLREIGAAMTAIPADFKAHQRLARVIDERRQAIESGQGIDWATGEALAFGALLLEGKRVRLSGQDSPRGTFSQRHAALIDQETEARHVSLNHIRPGAQADFEVINSCLSEAGVLGFEYGYSLSDPNTLVLWEAQFGDFANGAQVIIDQFIVPGESKWLRMSGLVMLLPHGYEGQGPEHSSARLERYLQLAAEQNIQVVNCTTPASFFHVLRRQMKRNFRKPLIAMTPKSLLRHKLCVSPLADFGPGTVFHRVLGESQKLTAPEKVRRVVLCTGKIYYDLLEARTARKIDDVALIRLEQIAPFPNKSLTVELAKYPKADVVWCQEEPRNMGAFTYVDRRIEDVLAALSITAKRARYVGRPESASPATGFLKVHIRQQEALVTEALVA
ncbi:MAG: 2-oxoglutarate dehydrogenase E1 component [Alphaproteobacteria bacterium]|nr:2-oxoglutarate dehydrogenase E1 component [Alphaproteobacteria bacterium]